MCVSTKFKTFNRFVYFDYILTGSSAVFCNPTQDTSSRKHKLDLTCSMEKEGETKKNVLYNLIGNLEKK